MVEPVRLGEITCPSGQLVIADGGHLRLWSGDRSPLETPVEVLGRAPDPEVEGEVAHRELVRRLATDGGGEFWMSSVPAVAVTGVPRDHLLMVTAEPDPHGWRELRVDASYEPVAQSTLLGEVGVDWARIAFADADALGSWRHDETIDGLADVVFWGAAEVEAAGAFDAPLLTTPGEEGVYGWVDLPEHEAVQRAKTVSTWRDQHAVRRLAVDYRPHSHHWQVMRGVRASQHDAGMIEVGGAWMLFAMTSRGDGYFPVVADLDSLGQLVAIRVLLAEDDDVDD